MIMTNKMFLILMNLILLLVDFLKDEVMKKSEKTLVINITFLNPN